MDRLQPQSHFQFDTGFKQEISKSQNPVTAEFRVVLNDARFKTPYAFCDGRIVRNRDRHGIEEICAVVEFDVACRGQLAERQVDLRRDRARRNRLFRRLLPQVTHQAAKRAFFIREEHGRHVVHSTCR